MVDLRMDPLAWLRKQLETADVDLLREIGIDLVPQMGFSEPALGVEGRHPHPAHEGGSVIEGGHERQIGLACAGRLVVEAGTGEIKKTSLAGFGQHVGPVDHRFALGPPMRPSAPDKKSFSMVSWPILAWREAMLGPSSVAFSSSPMTIEAPS